MDKLQKFYNLSSIKDIKTSIINQVVTPPPTTFAPTPAVEATAAGPRVDQLTSVVITLFVEDPTLSFTPLKRGHDEYMHSPLEEGSHK